MAQQRYDLVQEVLHGQASVTALAAKYNISRKSVYKWVARYLQDGEAGLVDQSRRPHHSPRGTADEVCAAVTAERAAHPAWGAGKLHAVLQPVWPELPDERTVHRILTRAGLVRPPADPAPEPQRFERGAPNELWQLDFKGPLRLGPSLSAPRVLTLSVVDDHSRFLVMIQALPNRQFDTVWSAIWATFGAYGLPEAVLTDNEAGLFGSHRGGITRWTACLWRLGISHLRGRPYHPQTQGKIERFHGTLELEVLKGRYYTSLEGLATALAQFRSDYNHVRPHEALEQRPPASRYVASPRPRPDQLPEVEYAPGATLRRVNQGGYVSLRGRRVHVGEGLEGQQVEVRDEGDCFSLRYAERVIRRMPWEELTGANQWV